jgi:hypothetical protein
MQRALFFEAAGELSKWVQTLFLHTEDALRQAEDALCWRRDRPPDWPPAGAVVCLIVGGIGQRIEEVMTAYDRLRRATGLRPRFEGRWNP